MKFLLIQTFVNLVLDPLFIFGLGPVPAMGVLGAGLAMIVSRVVLVVLVFRHFISGKSNVVPVVKKFRFDFSLIKEILRIGIPSTITFMSSSIGLMLFMKLVSGYGPLAIAAFGIGGRVENIAILPALGMSGAILTIVGQNYGARKLERAQKTIRNSMLLLALFMLSVAGVSLLFAKPIVSIFTQNAEVVSLSVDFLYIRAPFWAFMGVRMIIGAGFNGVGNPKVGLLTLLFGLFAVGLPAAMVLQASLGLNAVWLGLSLANLSGTIAAYGIYRWRFPKGREHGA